MNILGWMAKFRSGLASNFDGKIATVVGGVGGGAIGANIGGVGVAVGGTAFGIPALAVAIAGAILGAWLLPKGHRLIRQVFTKPAKRVVTPRATPR